MLNINQKNVSVVIADDDSLTRSVLRLMLQEQLYHVVSEVGDGEKAVEVCMQLRPDIAFIDIEMPKLDGHAVTRKLHRDNPHVKIIMISALATMDNVQLAMQAGASGFVVKPFNAIKVIEAVNNCLRKH